MKYEDIEAGQRVRVLSRKGAIGIVIAKSASPCTEHPERVRIRLGKNPGSDGFNYPEQIELIPAEWVPYDARELSCTYPHETYPEEPGCAFIATYMRHHADRSDFACSNHAGRF